MRTPKMIVNGRRIMENPPVGSYAATWYTVELRGPKFQGECLYVIVGFDSLEAAIAEAERRGPLPDEPEVVP
jgi:hypothetical protein